MPLDRRNVTSASRVMLPTYIVINVAFAGAFLTDPQGRLELAPSLDFARGWMPIDHWGALWLLLAGLMLVALAIQHRTTFIAALGVNTGAWFSWGLLTEAAVLSQPNVSLLAGVLPWFVAVASFASMLSLLAREL